MAENVTPVVLKVKDFAPREVLLVNYKFNQATDQEGQVAGIVRGGQILIRVKALNDGNPELLAWMLDPAAPHDLEREHKGWFSHEDPEGYCLLLRTLQGVLGRRRGAL